MKDATDENNDVMAERVERSTELEDVELCMWLCGVRDDLRFAESNMPECGRLLTVARPSYL